MSPFVEFLVSALLLAGGGFALVGSFALAKLSRFELRLHGPTKASTLGVGGVLAASAIFFSASGPGLSLHEILIALFLFLTAPVSAHLLAKAAIRAGTMRPPEGGGSEP
jgi:multicomponent K+:H+ antiporter subunit G